MNKEQVLQDEGLLKRFTRDYKVPINIFVPEVFLERLEIVSKFKPDIKRAWNDFLEVMSRFDNAQDYFYQYNKIKDDIINSIKSTDGYNRFNEEDMQCFQVVKSVRDLNLPSSDIYKQSNTQKVFLSFDMVKANFSALSYYDKEIFNGKDTWEEFVKDFIPKELQSYIVTSKYMREVVLGNCNPKRHITYEKYLMSLMVKELIRDLPDYVDDIVFFSNDEIIFVISSDEQDELISKYFLNNKLGISMKKEKFVLFSLGINIGYMKCKAEEGDGEDFSSYPFTKFETKAVNNFCMPFVLRRALGQDITENDKLFMHPNEGLLCKFIDTPMIEMCNDLEDLIYCARWVDNRNSEK